MVGGNVQRFQIHLDAALLRDFRALQQRVVHGAELYRVGERIVVVNDHAALAQAVGVDGHTAGAHLFGSRHRLLQKVQIRRFLLRVDERKLRVSIEAGNADAGIRRSGLHRVQVLVRPAPELHKIKTVILGRLEPVQEGKLTVHGLDACGFEKLHVRHRLSFSVLCTSMC